MRGLALDPQLSAVPRVGSAEEDPAGRTAPLQPRRAERLALEVPGGDRVALDRGLSIGQADRNQLVIRDPTVSRRHCVIEVFDGRAAVRDLGSTNGTFVNGLKVSRAELHQGAVLALGAARLRILGEAAEDELLVGESESMRRLRRQVSVLAPTGLSVLVQGETGTGKELVARALHAQSGRHGLFVPLNCGAIAKDLVESELFGHERGAFTGAQARRPGVFQEADGGTLFLDEIGELPLGLQSRLLRVLENGAVRPVGSNREVAVDVRVVAATHVDLLEAIARRQFREDLYYRLAAATLVTPALRAHRDDLPLLIARLLRAEEPGSGPCRVSEAALARLADHDWPGNVRELKNVLLRAVALGGPVIEPQDLELRGAPRAPDGDALLRVDGRPYLELEREILARAIHRHRGNKRAAAHALGIPKSTLCDKARRYGIGDPPSAEPID